MKHAFAIFFLVLISTGANAYSPEQCQAALKIAQNPYSTPAAQQVAVNVLTGCLAAAAPPPPQAQAAPPQAPAIASCAPVPSAFKGLTAFIIGKAA